MDKLKTHTVKSDYHIIVEKKGKPLVTFTVHADTVSNALKGAYEANCGWQQLPVENLGVQKDERV